MISGLMGIGVNIYDIVEFILKYGLLAWAAVIPATAFPILYAKWFPFWKSTLGRALFTKAVGLCLLVDTAVLYTLLPVDPTLKKVLGFVVGLIIVAGMWWQLIAITKIRMADRMVYESAQIDDTHRSHDNFEDRHRL